ncbi:MNIO family bufferin maturase [Leeia aquatica]|uniref:DUF692 domain-containing protein n=1 Tax=Leeia aquatica TaxID=2725557 RepID=A0A847SC79_9NEIS|nr:DUF692 domain-containing protein [Leeia aquatica]NLR74949.1 DUF692 domain-containing protein [Leeia aquatica]
MVSVKQGLPLAAGLGLRSPHVRDVVQQRPDVAWWEVHSENYFGGGRNLDALRRVRADYPISLHGVGMGLGNPGPLDLRHLTALQHLVREIEPHGVSEHLSWNRVGDTVFNDLLPLPYRQDALLHVADKVNQLQDALGRTVLIENVSAYVRFAGADTDEAALLAELHRRTGCGILLDVNNVYVNQINLGLDPQAFLAALPCGAVQEIHIAGHSQGDGFLLDTHDAAVIEPVWALLEQAWQRFGPQPTLLERDGNISPLTELLIEYQEVSRRLQQHRSRTEVNHALA